MAMVTIVAMVMVQLETLGPTASGKLKGAGSEGERGEEEV